MDRTIRGCCRFAHISFSGNPPSLRVPGALKCLQSLRVHELKIDRTFVTHMTERTRDAAIVRCAIDMTKAFDVVAVAEGDDVTRPLPPRELETHSDQPAGDGGPESSV